MSKLAPSLNLTQAHHQTLRITDPARQVHWQKFDLAEYCEQARRRFAEFAGQKRKEKEERKKRNGEGEETGELGMVGVEVEKENEVEG